jgi:hypothetical protein
VILSSGLERKPGEPFRKLIATCEYEPTFSDDEKILSRRRVRLSVGQPLAVLRVLVALADFPAHIIKHNANPQTLPA